MVRTFCSLFGHRRDSRRAYPSSLGWRAPCRWCGERLVRVAPGKWQVLDDAGPVVPLAGPSNAARHPFEDRGGAHRVEFGPARQRDGGAGALFEWGQASERRPGAIDGPPARAFANHQSEAEMFAIALGYCREMLSRLADRLPAGTSLAIDSEHQCRSVTPTIAEERAAD